jgi:hypothetical protein
MATTSASSTGYMSMINTGGNSNTNPPQNLILPASLLHNHQLHSDNINSNNSSTLSMHPYQHSQQPPQSLDPVHSSSSGSSSSLFLQQQSVFLNASGLGQDSIFPPSHTQIATTATATTTTTATATAAVSIEPFRLPGSNTHTNPSVTAFDPSFVRYIYDYKLIQIYV